MKKRLRESDDWADSVWSRLSAKKSSKGGKSVQQMLGIVDQGMEPPGGRDRMTMMDIVLATYEKGLEDDEED